MPNRVIVFGKNGEKSLKNIIPFIDFYKPKEDGSPIVYVCQNFTCQLPTSNFEIIKKQLDINQFFLGIYKSVIVPLKISAAFANVSVKVG